METKKEIRTRSLKERDGMAPEERREKSREIAARMFMLPVFREAEEILIYRSFRSEVETDRMIEKAWEEGKRVYAPRVEGREMEFYRVSGWKDFETGTWGIQEPGKDCPAFEKAVKNRRKTEKKRRVLVILPGAAFDKECRRIGYGGGFYDRYLENLEDAEKLAVCFEKQITDKIPAKPFDIRPEWVLTEEHLYGKGERPGK